MEDQEPAAPGPLFVVGTPRSGTSLLLALLNQHPAVSLMYEAHVLRFRPIVGRRRVRRDWATRLDFWNGACTRHGLDARLLPPARTAREAARLLYAQFAPTASVSGEKSIAYVHDLDAVVETFPEARLIVIWRDPAAVYGSIHRAASRDRFFARVHRLPSLLVTLERFQASVQRLTAAGVPVHQVRYEALTEDPADTMKEVAGFLEVPFVEQMGSLAGADLSTLPSGPHHSLIGRSEIVRSRPAPETAPATAAKIARYRARWKRHFPDLLLSDGADGARETPGPRELAADRLSYHSMQVRETTARALYTMVPVGLWGAYRRLRSGEPGAVWGR